MKKIICIVLVVMMAAALFVGCTKDDKKGEETIKIGILGPHTGELAVYGLGVKNGATLYLDQVNAAGGINGKMIEIIAYDQRGDDAEAVNAFNRMVSEGITGLIGDVITSNTLAVVAKATPINMPMITASATAASVTVNADGSVNTNVFRTCFIDPFQGMKMAEFAGEVLDATSAAVLFETGNDYAIGLKDAFVAKCGETGIEVVGQESYAKGDKDFKAQLTNILAAGPDVVFLPNYYEDNGLIVTQAREIGLNAVMLGGDGWAGITDYASAEDLEGSFFCSAYAPGSTELVRDFEARFIAANGEDTLNMFAATGYDAAMLLVAAIRKAEKSGSAPASDEYKQAIIDAIRSEGAGVVGVTSEGGYTFDEFNNPIKDAVIMTITDGKEVFYRMF
ncbi:MAG: ABC transporter substrate-binding protein [Clostridiales bacterium]|nr:ABC transporter substrate-binding protein [Clostridiales bacterium]